MVTGTIKREPTQFVLVKNCVGSITIVLESYDFGVPARSLRLDHKQSTAYVMTRHALGVFVTPNALQQMEQGYFTFENLAELIKMAEEKGFYVPDSIKEPQVSLKEIADILREGDEKKVTGLVANLNSKLANDIASAGRDLYPRLNQLTINILEKALKTSLASVDLSE